jgi:hypothetical protein
VDCPGSGTLDLDLWGRRKIEKRVGYASNIRSAQLIRGINYDEKKGKKIDR